EGGSERGVDGGHATGSSTGGGGGGGGGGSHGGGKGHGAQDGNDGGGGGGGGGQSMVVPVAGQRPHFYNGPDGSYGNRDRLNDGKVELIVPIPSKRSRVELISGNSQSAYSGQPFAQPLRVRFVDAIHGPQAGKSITFSMPAGQPRAAVFADGGDSTRVTTDADGFAQVNLTALPAAQQGELTGGFLVRAAASDDPAHLIGGAVFRLHDDRVPTEIEVTTSAPDQISQVGQPVSFSAKVAQQPGTTPAFGTPAGHVRFEIDGVATPGPIELVDGVATLPAISGLRPGTHHVLATYLADDPTRVFAPVFGSVGLLVQSVKLPTEVRLTLPPSPVLAGAVVGATVTVPTPQPDAPKPTGAIQFGQNGSLLGDPVTIAADGTASSPPLRAGLGTIEAHYLGDEVYEQSRVEAELTVYTATSTTTVTANHNPVTYFEQLDLTTTITRAPAGEIDTGTVRFAADGKPLGAPVPVDDGLAIARDVDVSHLGFGTHLVTADYSGDADTGVAPSRGTMTLWVLKVGQSPGDHPADVGVHLDLPRTADPGDRVTATVTVTNVGGRQATEVEARLSTQGWSRVVDPGGGEVRPTHVRFRLPTLAAGETRTYTVVLEAPPRLALITAFLHASSTSTDANPVNNLHLASTFVRAGAS
ncbi:Ig-like domain-containing protein, partial [Nocardia sp. No.11]|uniref:Ig-like domain-containing protein n=1 Tax=Nocardia sp. No.11 TaxID=3128861 RepID=UPI00319DCFFE